MKKFMIALAATLGLGAATTAPAQAGGNWSFSAGVYTTAPTYYAPVPVYKAPTYYAPVPVYRAPVYVPRYYNPLPAITFSFGNTNRNYVRAPKKVNKRKVLTRQVRNLDRRIERLDNRRDRLENRLERVADRRALRRHKH